MVLLVYCSKGFLSYFVHAVSCYSLFPLLFEAQEYPIKVLLLLLHSSLMWLGFSAQFDKRESVKQTGSKSKRHVQTKRSMTATGETFRIRFVEKVYLVGLLVVEIWAQFLHPFILGGKFPFVPLMLISTYCSLGVMYSWIWQLRWILKPPTYWFIKVSSSFIYNLHRPFGRILIFFWSDNFISGSYPPKRKKGEKDLLCWSFCCLNLTLNFLL